MPITIKHTAPYASAHSECLTFESPEELNAFLEKELKKFKDFVHHDIDKDFVGGGYDFCKTPEEAHKYFEEHYHIEWHDKTAYISFPPYHYTEGYCDQYEIIAEE